MGLVYRSTNSIHIQIAGIPHWEFDGNTDPQQFQNRESRIQAGILEITVQVLFGVSAAWSWRYFYFWTLRFMRDFRPNSDYLSTNLRPKPPWTPQRRRSSSSG